MKLIKTILHRNLVLLLPSLLLTVTCDFRGVEQTVKSLPIKEASPEARNIIIISFDKLGASFWEVMGAMSIQRLHWTGVPKMGSTNTPYIESVNQVISMSGALKYIPVKGNKLDTVFICPHNLSCSLGVPQQYSYPSFKEAATWIIETLRKTGIIRLNHIRKAMGDNHFGESEGNIHM